MSTKTMREVSCPNCGTAVKTEMWAAVTAPENPEVRASLMGETLFDWKCPECGYEARLLYPCLYHDRERCFMVYMAPNGSGNEFQPVDVSERFPQLAQVTKRVVSSPAELKEKILIFEAGLDDRAVELVKFALAGVMENKYGKKTVEGYFCGADQEEDKISFAFFPQGESRPVQRSTRMGAYLKSLEIVRQSSSSDGGNRFIPVDALTARGILDEYRGAGHGEEPQD